jgi:hypothetical protein
MKRDMDIIRKIVLTLRDSDTVISKVEGIPDNEYLVHAQLVIEAGLAEGNIAKSGHNLAIPGHVRLVRLTWPGQDFADAIKDDNIWNKAKEHVMKPAASWTFDILLKYLGSLITGNIFGCVK